MYPIGKAGRGGSQSRFGFVSRKKMSAQSPPVDFPAAAGPLLESLSNVSLSVPTTIDARIAACEIVASYNWLTNATATVQIPGAPPRWTPLLEPATLKQDSGEYFRDVNAARSPSYPMEPAVRALLQTHPDLDLDPDFGSIDLCACNSTLGNLLRFVRGIRKPFRFWVEVLGGTAFFVRMEHSPKELIEGIHGYGHTFPEAYTTWPQNVRDSESHQRVLKYSLAGMNLLVRHEGDGYLEELVPEDEARKELKKPRKSEETTIEEQMSSMLGKQSPSSSESLLIETGGITIPQKAVFDLKTRSITKKGQDVLADELPRLWIGQIPNFILAFHENGRFQEIRVQKIPDQIRDWEQDNQDDLRKYVDLVKVVIKTASEVNSRKLEVRSTSEGKLELRELLDKQWSALPIDLHKYFTLIRQVQEEEEPINDDRQSPTGSSGQSAADSGDDSDDVKDYTACGIECGYCGRCPY